MPIDNQGVGYRDYSDFLKEHFQFKVQKISINAGFVCPNRDGTKGVGGCIYCNNQSFSPSYCMEQEPVSQQIAIGKEFFSKKYPEMKYLAYFQSYTNTYGSTQSLMKLYTEALSQPDVVGLIIATRPDCVSDELLSELGKLAKHTHVMIEYGVESSHDETLKIINRGHTWADVVSAVERTHNHGILCGAHLILGLPGETLQHYIATAQAMSKLPVATVKLHQLQIIKGTRLAQMVANGGLTVQSYTPQEYIDICVKFLENLNPRIAVERFVSQSPDGLLISPRWGLKNYEFTNLLNAVIKRGNVRQGSNFEPQK